MADEGVAAVVEAPVVDAQPEITVDESSQSTPPPGVKSETPDDKLDGRNKPDPDRKYLAELRRQAEAEKDPARKADILERVKNLNNKVGKVGAYEALFPTVREVREVKALLDTFGAEHNGDWKTGLTTMQQRIGEARQIDAQLEAGDPAVVQKIWDEAPNGVPKIIPALVEKFAAEKPEEYKKFIATHAIGHLDASGFPQAFDAMVKLYEAGKTEEAKALKLELIGWVSGQRQSAKAEAPKVDPEVARLRNELNTRNEKDTTTANNTALTAVETHAVPVLEKAIKAIVGKLGLTQDQVQVLVKHAWNDLVETRNKDSVYKTVATSKYGQGANTWAEYAKGWTTDNAETSARKISHLYYGHQLKNGAAKTAVDATRQPTAQTVTKGAAPSPNEIDYGPKGLAYAKKNGFSKMDDYVLSHKVLLKDGTVRHW
jgi:hypothetical protein